LQSMGKWSEADAMEKSIAQAEKEMGVDGITG
jgi:hypothetical protein